MLGQLVRFADPLPSTPTTMGASVAYRVSSTDGEELFEFDSTGRHLATRSATSLVTQLQFAYDGAGNLISATDADGRTTLVERDANARAAAIVGPFGQRTTLAHDANGYLSAITDPASRTIALQHDALGMLQSLTDPRGGVHTFVYDAGGRLTADNGTAGRSTNLARVGMDSSFTVTTTTAMGRATQYLVRRIAQQVWSRTTTNAAGLATTTHSSGDTTGVTLPDGSSFFAQRVGDPRFGMQAPRLAMARLALPSGNTAQMQTRRHAVMTDSLDPTTLLELIDSVTINGRTAVSRYVVASRTLTQTSPEGRTTTTLFDAKDRVSQVSAPGVAPVSYTYTPAGLISTVTQGGRSASFAYNANGYLTSTTDPLGRTESFTSDATGRVIQQTQVGGVTVAYTYDANGNLTSLTPPGRPAHSFTYTAGDQAATYVPPSAGLHNANTGYTYNADQQLTQLLRPDGLSIDISYDNSGRPRKLGLPADSLNITYAVSGQVSALRAPSGQTLAFAYDGSLPLSTTWGGVVQGSVGLSYDSDMRVTGIGVNGGNAIALGYDSDDLLTSAGLLALARDATTGRLTGTTLGQLTTSVLYDANFGVPTATTAAFNGSTLFQTSYQRDALERITQLTETIQGTTRTWSYAYDSAGRLDQVQLNGTLASDYDYDANGNRIRVATSGGVTSATVDDQDRLLTYGTTSYIYSTNGELTRTIVGTDTTKYTYDVLGNLTTVVIPSGPVVEYIIDGQNRRIGRKVNGTLVQGFLYMGQLAPVAELDGNNSVVSRFVYGTHTNVPEYMEKGGVTYRLVTDHLGSVRLVVNSATGAVAQRLDYDEYGRVTQNTNPGFQPFGYAGGLHDAATGLVRFGARDYDASAGRWTSKDPIGFNGGDANLYSYVGNDPLSSVDPSGLAWDIVDIGFFLWSLRDFLCKPGFGTGIGLGLDAFSLLPIIPSIGWITRTDDVAEIAKRFTPDQEALVELARRAEKRGGVSPEDANTLRRWADEVGLPSRGPESHPSRGFGSREHIHIGPVNHLPVVR